MEANSRKKLVAFFAVLIVIVAIVGTVAITKKQKSDSTTAVESTSPATSNADTLTNSDPAASSSASAYKDGDYTASGDYSSPGGQETITIKVTLKDGVVTETSATAQATDDEAQEYQDQFISGYKQLVVGKKVDAVRLSRVAGSSLTSQGFNNALDQIKSQAKV